jgi:hypothetical protein
VIGQEVQIKYTTKNLGDGSPEEQENGSLTGVFTGESDLSGRVPRYEFTSGGDTYHLFVDEVTGIDQVTERNVVFGKTVTITLTLDDLDVANEIALTLEEAAGVREEYDMPGTAAMLRRVAASVRKQISAEEALKPNAALIKAEAFAKRDPEGYALFLKKQAARDLSDLKEN